MTRRRWPAAVLAVVVAGLGGCADDPSDATPPTTTPVTTIAPSADTTTAPSAVATTTGGGASGAVDPALCPTVQAWSDAIVDAVRTFTKESRTLDPAGRRASYAQAFTEQTALHDRLTAAVDRMALPEPVRSSLDDALASVALTITDGADGAAALPEGSYDTVAVRDGKLLVGTEKSKAIVFNTLADLADAGVPTGCGRRGALDLSPSVTFPP
jgi:hypothetical protein